jgi:hypothetical protein
MSKRVNPLDPTVLLKERTDKSVFLSKNKRFSTMPVFKRQFHNPNATISNFLRISDMYKYAQ